MRLSTSRVWMTEMGSGALGIQHRPALLLCMPLLITAVTFVSVDRSPRTIQPATQMIDPDSCSFKVNAGACVCAGVTGASVCFYSCLCSCTCIYLHLMDLFNVEEIMFIQVCRWVCVFVGVMAAAAESSLQLQSNLLSAFSLPPSFFTGLSWYLFFFMLSPFCFPSLLFNIFHICIIFSLSILSIPCTDPSFVFRLPWIIHSPKAAYEIT